MVLKFCFYRVPHNSAVVRAARVAVVAVAYVAPSTFRAEGIDKAKILIFEGKFTEKAQHFTAAKAIKDGKKEGDKKDGGGGRGQK